MINNKTRGRRFIKEKKQLGNKSKKPFFYIKQPNRYRIHKNKQN